MNIFLIGLGLIGGSMGLNFRKLIPDAVLWGIDINHDHLNKALNLGIIDRKSEESELHQADLVVVAVPANLTASCVIRALDSVSDGAMVIDTASTKYNICEEVKNHPKRGQFIAMHPIAGTEFSGPEAGFLELFQDKTNIICEKELVNSSFLQPIENYCLGMGMKISYMTAFAHDLHIAYVSHLSHISSFMLGKTVIEKEKDEQQIFNMAGSGFASTVRLAKSSPVTWTAIFKENKTNVRLALKEYISNLKQFEELLQSDDYQSINEELEATNRIKEILKGLNH